MGYVLNGYVLNGYVWKRYVLTGYVLNGYVWDDAYWYAWCEIRQQSSEEPCGETFFGKKERKSPNGIEEGRTRRRPIWNGLCKKAPSPSQWSHLVIIRTSQLIVYTVTSYKHWLFGCWLVEVEFDRFSPRFWSSCQLVPLRMNLQASFLANCGMALAPQKAKSTIGFEGEQSEAHYYDVGCRCVFGIYKYIAGICQRRSAQTSWQQTSKLPFGSKHLYCSSRFALCLELVPLGAAFPAALDSALAFAALLVTRQVLSFFLPSLFWMPSIGLPLGSREIAKVGPGCYLEPRVLMPCACG